MLLGEIWQKARGIFGPPNVEWCEAPLRALVEEPANTWSNLAYLVVAFIVYRFLYKTSASDSANRGEPNHRMKHLAHAVFWMGLFSLFYHASNNALTQWFDFLGMFFYVGLLLTWNAERLHLIKPHALRTFWLGTLAVNVAALVLLWFLKVPIQIIVGMNTLLIFVSEFLIYKNKYRGRDVPPYGDYFRGAALMLLASISSVTDLKRIWCVPDNHLLQGHAVWHVYSAAAIFYTARFYARLSHPSESR